MTHRLALVCCALAVLFSASRDAWADVVPPKGFKPTVPFVVTVDENIQQPKLIIPQRFVQHRVGLNGDDSSGFRTAAAGVALSVGIAAALFVGRRRSKSAALAVLCAAALFAGATAWADVPLPGRNRGPNQQLASDPRFDNVPTEVVVSLVAHGDVIRLQVPASYFDAPGNFGAPAPAPNAQ
ncbi:MAG: hypothetical protein JSS27_08620 [Planctomycetes bacterium]|nr:hypothetical protein [Planctomycetota bacterium]